MKTKFLSAIKSGKRILNRKTEAVETSSDDVGGRKRIFIVIIITIITIIITIIHHHHHHCTQDDVVGDGAYSSCPVGNTASTSSPAAQDSKSGWLQLKLQYEWQSPN